MGRRRTSIIMAGLALGLLLGGAPAGAQSVDTPLVDQREANQEQRIQQGVDSETLTPGEAGYLNREQGRIHRTEERMQADGRVYPRERHRLNQMQDRASGDIYRLKHNHWNGAGWSGHTNSGWGGNPYDSGFDRRQAYQQERIQQGIASGALSPGEARYLNREQARIDRAEGWMMADGRLSPWERHRLNQMQNHAGRDIYRLGHNGWTADGHHGGHYGWDNRHQGWDRRHQGWDGRHYGWDRRHHGWDGRHYGWDRRHHGWDGRNPGWNGHNPRYAGHHPGGPGYNHGWHGNGNSGWHGNGNSGWHGQNPGHGGHGSGGTTTGGNTSDGTTPGTTPGGTTPGGSSGGTTTAGNHQGHGSYGRQHGNNSGGGHNSGGTVPGGTATAGINPNQGNGSYGRHGNTPGGSGHAPSGITNNGTANARNPQAWQGNYANHRQPGAYQQPRAQVGARPGQPSAWQGRPQPQFQQARAPMRQAPMMRPNMTVRQPGGFGGMVNRANFHGGGAAPRRR